MKLRWFFVATLIVNQSFAQPDINLTGSESNLLEYSAAFLDINTNSRLGGFGEVGTVTSPFYKNAGVYQNPALISNNGQFAGINAFYEPWLKNIVSDVNLYGISGFYAADSSNALAINFTYFNLGEINYTDNNGYYIGTDKSYEYFIKLAYSRSFNKSISAGIALKFFKSKIASALIDVNTIHSISFDFGLSYQHQYNLNNKSFLNTNAGLALTNLGPRISYVEGEKDFIPQKLSLGLFINPDIYIHKNFRFNIELGYQAEKYLVPTPPAYDFDGNITNGYDPDISSLKALYQSFYDAPGGFDEEINEIKHKFGSEFRLSFLDYGYIAFRHGRHLEHETKGNRNYQTFGYGIGLYGFMLDYMKIKAENDSPLHGTWILTAGYSFNLDKSHLRF
ncbi:MAG TPA: hypothetical protein DCG75_01575 [Bacteroidales bacterium]|nr:hypothetical protein [Bacteroidales bacterium]